MIPGTHLDPLHWLHTYLKRIFHILLFLVHILSVRQLSGRIAMIYCTVHEKNQTNRQFDH